MTASLPRATRQDRFAKDLLISAAFMASLAVVIAAVMAPMLSLDDPSIPRDIAIMVSVPTVSALLFLTAGLRARRHGTRNRAAR